MGSTGLSDAVVKESKQEIEAEEHYEPHVYQCSKKVWTIGIGRNVDKNKGGKGLSYAESLFMLDNDFVEVVSDLNRVFLPSEFLSFPEPVQKALINMRFQFGPHKFRGFKDTILAAKKRDWRLMADEMKDSHWFRVDTPKRAQRQIDKVRSVIS